MKRIVYLLMCVILPLLSFGDDAVSSLFDKGNAYYSKAEYKEALDTYRKILSSGYASSSLYFNMGNASYKLDSIPAALLYFEKAHKLSPADADINFNIRFVNSKTTDKIDRVPELFISRWWRSFIMSFSVNALSILSVIVFLLGSGLLILYFFAEAVSIKRNSFYAAVFFFFIGLSMIFIANRQLNYFDEHKEAIIFAPAVTVKSAPAEQSAALVVIHSGNKVNIIGNHNGWDRVRLANGNGGWIKEADLKEI